MLISLSVAPDACAVSRAACAGGAATFCLGPLFGFGAADCGDGRNPAQRHDNAGVADVPAVNDVVGTSQSAQRLRPQQPVRIRDNSDPERHLRQRGFDAVGSTACGASWVSHRPCTTDSPRRVARQMTKPYDRPCAGGRPGSADRRPRPATGFAWNGHCRRALGRVRSVTLTCLSRPPRRFAAARQLRHRRQARRRRPRGSSRDTGRGAPPRLHRSRSWFFAGLISLLNRTTVPRNAEAPTTNSAKQGPRGRAYRRAGQTFRQALCRPKWEARDSSKVAGKDFGERARSEESAIAWLLLSAGSSGSGVLAGTRFVQRLNTAGGVGPTGACPEARNRAACGVHGRLHCLQVSDWTSKASATLRRQQDCSQTVRPHASPVSAESQADVIIRFTQSPQGVMHILSM